MPATARRPASNGWRARAAMYWCRINPQSLPLQEKGGGNFDLLSHLQTLDTAGAAGEWQVSLPDTAIEGRVCALRKSEEAIQQARRRIERRASKKQTTTKPETWEYA